MKRALFRFYEELNDFLPSERRKQTFAQAFESPVPVRHLIENLGVPHTEVELILVNGNSVGLDYPVENNDRVSVYPVFESFDVTPLLRIRSKPLRRLRFLADAHLGKLTHYLRMLGFDTLFFNDLGDAALATLAVNEKRVLLTRDKALLMHKKINQGCYIRSGVPKQQLLQVFKRLDLTSEMRPFSLCMECNGSLQNVEKSQIVKTLPEGVALRYNEYWRCEGCQRIYWKGHHFQAMQKWINSLKEELTPQA